MVQYDFKEVEQRILDFWSREQIYKTDFKRAKFSIDTPPPTVSGKMHIGHAFSYSQQDFIARYRRMKEGVFYPFGTDDNGLPTERLIERLKGVKSKTMSRAAFIALCLQTLKEITPDFIADWKKIGISCDFDLTYSTIDNTSQKISQQSFIQLYKKGIAYKKNFPTLWCPECQTAIAQAELEDKEKENSFVYVCAEVSGGGTITYATTRPELLHGCVCISVSKDDPRYKKFVGKKAKIPLSNSWVPIITDISAKKDFGTGAVYWCPYGDKNDVSFLERHPEFIAKPVLDKTGRLNEHAVGYSGMKVYEARKKIIADLESLGVVKKIEPITHVANVHDKCGTQIEFITTEQWFIKILDQRKQLLAQGKKVAWRPSFMRKRYENWVSGLEWDWSISRDRHFGVPIPVWYCDCGEIAVASEKELPVDPLVHKKICRCGKEMQGEEKVFDTWMTSSLTPQIVQGLSDKKVKIPFSLRPQAHDIIRTWAFYTIVKSLYQEKNIPWKAVMISGFVTLGKEKMSKSKGNVIEPQKVTDVYGADALRFWAAGSKLGEDLDYQEQDLVAGKKLLNKLVNAANFVFMNLQDYDGKKPKKLEQIDELFLAKLNELVTTCTKSFEEYEYARAKLETEKFFFKNFADNYLEIVKKRVYMGEGVKRKSAQYTLYMSLLTLLKLFAPIIPFATEAMYQEHFRKSQKDTSIHLSAWPKSSRAGKSEAFDLFLEVLSQIRQEKTNNQKPMNAQVIIWLDKATTKKLGTMIEDLCGVVAAREIKEGKFKVEFV